MSKPATTANWAPTADMCKPMRCRKPRHWRIDTLDDAPFAFIDRVFAVMALCPQHTFQVLTKRPERMAQWFGHHCENGFDTYNRVMMRCPHELLSVTRPYTYLTVEHYMRRGLMDVWNGTTPWPLPNVWLGTSAEDQKTLDDRVPHLARCPAAARFLSCEPLLGPLDFSGYFGGQHVALPGDRVVPHYNHAGINWVIVGGESGPKARPTSIDDIRSVVRQCKAADVPCFVKQVGSKPYEIADNGPAVRSWGDAQIVKNGEFVQLHLRDRKGGDPAEWPEYLRVREFPTPTPASAGTEHTQEIER